MSWGEAQSLAPSPTPTTTTSNLLLAGLGALPAPVSKACLSACSSDYRGLCDQLAGCESRLGQAGWRQEVTDSHQPQDQSMHWTRPAGPVDTGSTNSISHRPIGPSQGIPFTIPPLPTRRGRACPDQSWTSLGSDWGIIRPPTTPARPLALTTLCFSRPASSPSARLPLFLSLSTLLPPATLSGSYCSQRQRLN